MSGKAVARTKAKHERRHFNDIASVRNFIESLNEHGQDKQWATIALKILNCHTQLAWPNGQSRRNSGVPSWFWPKVRRIADTMGVAKYGEVSCEVIWNHESTPTYSRSEVREIKINPINSRIAFAKLFGIELIWSDDYWALQVSKRRRRPVRTELKTKIRPAKPLEFASTEEIDMQKDSTSIDAMLSEIPVLEQKIEKIAGELRRARDELENKRNDIIKRLKSYGI